MISDTARSGIVAMRPFLPARDYPLSQAFYQALGFSMTPLGERLCTMRLGEGANAPAFLLQDFYAKELAENFMMHLLVQDVDAWWDHIDALDLASRFGVAAPRPPKPEPWGLRVGYVFDPSGVLWHVAAES